MDGTLWKMFMEDYEKNMKGQCVYINIHGQQVKVDQITVVKV